MIHGVRRIVSFNWPAYVVAALLLAVAVAMLRVETAGAMRAALLLGVALAGFWIASSLLASWLVYDRSPLTTWTWIREALRPAPRSWINVHCGVDDSSAALRRLLPGSSGRVFDIFDPARMTEPSIRRARALAAGEPAEATPFRDFPVPEASVEGAFLLLSAHELRSPVDRVALFGEIRRMLRPCGRAVVVEHLRDWANFLAFGPGFLHFHSRRSWHGCFARAGLAVRAELPMTPFVRVFVLQRQD